YDKVPVFESTLRSFLTYQHAFGNKNHFWAGENSFAHYTAGDLTRIKEVIDQAVTGFSLFCKKSDEQLHRQLDYESTTFFLHKRTTLAQLTNNLDNDATFTNFLHLLKVKPDEEGTWIVEMERKILRFFKGAGTENTLKTSELGRIQECLQHAKQSRKSLIGWARWRLVSNDRIFLTRVLVANDLRPDKEGFAILTERIDNRLNYEHFLSLIQAKPWLTSFPENMRKIDIQNWFFHQRLAYKSLVLFQALRNLDLYVPLNIYDRKQTVHLLKSFASLLNSLPSVITQGQNYLTENQLSLLLSGQTDIDKIKNELDRDFENLHDFHRLQDKMTRVEREVAESVGVLTMKVEEKIRQFKRSLAMAWIDHIESKYPILRSVSSIRFEQQIHELRQAVHEKQKISQEILLLKSRERTYQNIEYNRLNNRITYRDLLHQVTKKKKIWPLRRVISEFSDELFQLLPCWMASPESASAIFPMEKMFDLVIFDEASQCFAERGIPAMFRGRQVVIAGDSMQLKPSDLYRVKWEEDADDLPPDLEIDSLLDLSINYLPQVMLQGHYRSRSIDLIGFSNRHFYKNGLQMIPDRLYANAAKPALEYIKLDGCWEKNANLAEAEEVVFQIGNLSTQYPDKTIGIVTFNVSQQELILDLLEKRLSDGGKLPEDLFVKNIENVQGDERDIIVFSTAYAPDKDGKLQLRFGLLNQQGGENRLNVAITRAREKVILISSILPGQLHVESTRNEGPKLLKEYLSYVWDISHKKRVNTLAPTENHPQAWYLKNALTDAIQALQSEEEISQSLSFADLTVTKNGHFMGLVYTDDELYRESPSSKHVYVYLPDILNRKNWPILRIDSRNYWREPLKIIDELRVFLNRVSEVE
ncbi:MAG: AAA domain-containing protein, partial [Cyclobacteriaceae bacterium]|nr:AAA domain-containing protein [Cyclobacteriaceae bacterium]